MINRDLKNAGTKLFHDGVANLQVKSNKILPKRKKNSLAKQIFSRFGKLPGKFQDFFKNSRRCRNLGFSINDRFHNWRACSQAKNLSKFSTTSRVTVLFRDETLLTSETLSENKVYLTSNKKGTSECANSRKHGLLN